MLCPKCHSLLTKGAKYCDICGTRISQEDIQVEEVGSRVKNREKHKNMFCDFSFENIKKLKLLF